MFGFKKAAKEELTLPARLVMLEQRVNALEQEVFYQRVGDYPPYWYLRVTAEDPRPMISIWQALSYVLRHLKLNFEVIPEQPRIIKLEPANKRKPA